MSGCRWRTYLAIGGLALSLTSPLAAQESPESPAEGPPPIEEGQRVAPDAPAPQDDSEQAPTSDQPEPTESVGQSSTVESQRPTDEATQARREAAEQREKDDLVAQRSMARSAADLVVLTFRQIIVGLVGITLIGFTLYYTRKAVQGAIRAADAAEVAVTVTRESAEHQLRAYVTVENAMLAVTPGDKVAHVQIDISYKNSGQTPAYNVRARLATKPETRPLVIPLPDPGFTADASKTTMGAGSTGSLSHARALSESECRLIDKGTHVLWAWGRIEYEDIFFKEGGQPRHTNYRFHIQDLRTGGPRPFYRADKGNDAT